MKKLLVIAVALASVNAFATRARTTALGNSVHLIDVSTVYSNPADMFFVGGDYVNAESGITGGSSTDNTAGARNGLNNAEGMVVRSWGDAKAGLSIGHMSSLSTQLRSAASPALGLTTSSNYLQQNPIGLFYGMKAGDLAWAGSLVYSNATNKVAPNEKETSLGLTGGFRMGAMDARLGLGLGNTYQNDTAKFTGTTGITAAFGYWLDTTYLSANVTSAGFKVEGTTSGTEILKLTSMSYGVSATNSLKKDGSEFFYGIGLQNTENKTTQSAVDQTATTLAVPINFGLEVDANSWLVLRGSVTQSLPVLATSKTSTSVANSLNTVDYGPGSNNTTFSAGAGLKFNKLALDGTILSGGTQTYSTAALLGQVGMTYMF